MNAVPRITKGPMKTTTAIISSGVKEVAFSKYSDENMRIKPFHLESGCLGIDYYPPGTVVRVCRLTPEAERSSAC